MARWLASPGPAGGHPAPRPSADDPLDAAHSDRLEGNLAVIPGALAARLRAAAGTAVEIDPKGRPALRVHRTLYALPVVSPPPQRIAVLPATQPLLAFGVGLGERVSDLLTRRGPDAAPLWAWEPRAFVLAEALRRHDWSEALAAGRLRLLVGLDLLDHPELTGLPHDPHPVVSPLHYWERRALVAGFTAPRAVIVAGGLLIHELGTCLEAAGFQPWVLPLQERSVGEATDALRRVAPGLVVGVNHMVGLPELCGRLGLPLVEWEIDPSIDRVRPPTASVHTTLIATWRRQNVAAYRDAGFPRVVHLPLSADTRIRRPLPRAEWGEAPDAGAPVCFVGSSLVGQAGRHLRDARRILGRFLADRGQPPERAETLVAEVIDAQRANLEVWRVPELLEMRLPGLQTWLRRTGHLVEPAQMLGEVLGAEWRFNAVASCSAVGVEVWGDRGWTRLQHAGVTWRGSAGARDQLTRIYNRAPIQLDVGRIYQRDIVTLRVFDVLACGGFVLAEHSAELSDCFEVGVEVESWRTLRELRAKVAWFAGNPDARQRVADAGRRRVERDHRLQDRVAWLLAQRPGGASGGGEPAPDGGQDAPEQIL